MKVLVSTTRKQGERENDFCFVPEGELVMFGTECDTGTVDDACGCRRSLVGLDCRKGTTTVKVEDLDLTRSDVESMLNESQERAGWPAGDDASRMARRVVVRRLLEIASEWPVGVVLERRERGLQVR